MSADQLIGGYVASMEDAMASKGETSPIQIPRSGPANKAWYDGDNVFGGSGFQPFLQRLYGDQWKGGMLSQGRTFGDLAQSQFGDGGMMKHRSIGPLGQMGAK